MLVQDQTQSNLLTMLNEMEVSLLVENAIELKLGKNEAVYQSGQSSHYVYIIKSGRVKISTLSSDNKEVLKSLIHKGEMVGESAIFGQELRIDTASAMDSDVVLYQVPAGTVRKLMQNNPAFSFKITAQIAQKLRQAEKRLESLTFKNSRTRIIEFLKDTAQRQGKKVGFETLLRPFLTHQDIGNLTTTSRQTVSSVLNELKGCNKIYYDRHRLLIRDMSVL